MIRFVSSAGQQEQKNAGQHGSHPAFFVDLQQRLNCALLALCSLSLDFFRYRGLNGMSEIPKDLRVSRRPIQPLRESKLFRVM
jgi:hypothetical protein